MRKITKKLFGTLAALMIAVFALPPLRFGEIARAETYINAATAVESAETEPPTTGKFDDPFERAEGMEAEDLGAKFDDTGDEPFGDKKALISLAIIGAAVAAAVVAAVIIRKKNRGKKTKKSTEAARHNLSEAEAFIKKNPALYADVADMIRTRKCRFIYAREDGILFRDDDGFYENGAFVLAAKDEATARKIVLLFPEEHDKIKESAFVCHGEKQAEFCRDFFGFDRVTKCYQMTYTPPAPLPLKGALRFEKAGEKQLQTIIDTYDRESPDSLKKLVLAKKINAAYASESAGGEDDKAGENDEARENFVGYIGQHPEGSMGLLLIFPEYRRHGYAEELESYQINEILAEGRTPYAHIITDNFKSFSLQKKLGANVADDLVIWMSRSDRKKD